MKLKPIKQHLEENAEFIHHSLCAETLFQTIEYYKIIGYHPPWIGYYAEQDGELVGAAGIKGKPVNGKIELAYGTFEPYRNKGIGKAICKSLVELSLHSDPNIQIIARTLPEASYSTKILLKNNFIFKRTVLDPDDGDVWEWEYSKINESVVLKRTDADHIDFRTLVKALDQELTVIYGEKQSFYNPFNTLNQIKNVVIAFSNGMPMGCGAMKKFDDNSMEIKRMYILPAHRNKGVAHLILNELEDWAKELNYKECVLETGNKQPDAIRLYQKAGYEIIPNYGQYKDETESICMKKVLHELF